MANKTKIKKAAKKLKRKNAKLYYTLAAIVLVVAISLGVWAVVNPSSFENTFGVTIARIDVKNSDNGGGSAQETGKTETDGYYKGKVFSTTDGEIISDDTADVAFDTGLTVHFIDVGQGDAIYIEFPNGKDMLIDGGSVKKSDNPFEFVDGSGITGSKPEYLVKEYVAKYNNKNDKVIDYLLITHTDRDHYNLLPEVFEAFDIKRVYLPYVDIADFGTTATDDEKRMFEGGLKIKTKGYTEVVGLACNERIGDEECKIKCVEGNFKIDDIDENGVEFEVYSFDKNEYKDKGIDEGYPNELSPICVLKYNGRKIVLTGDAEEKSEKDYLDDSPPTVNCDVLKVGHHGSETSTSEAFLDDIKPEFAIISAGTHKTFKHPRQSTLEKFKKREIEYYCTIDCGTIVLHIGENGEPGDMRLYCAYDPAA